MLGIFEGETDVEAYNLIMNILLYVRLSTNSSNWKKWLGNTGWAFEEAQAKRPTRLDARKTRLTHGSFTG